jgi:hypothetical protein
MVSIDSDVEKGEHHFQKNKNTADKVSLASSSTHILPAHPSPRPHPCSVDLKSMSLLFFQFHFAFIIGLDPVCRSTMSKCPHLLFLTRIVTWTGRKKTTPSQFTLPVIYFRHNIVEKPKQAIIPHIFFSPSSINISIIQ